MKTVAQNVVELQTIAENLLSPCVLELFQNNVIVDADTVLAGLTKATYSGYAGITITSFGEPITNPDFSASIVGPLTQFNHNGGITANTIYGAYITDDLVTPTILRYCWNLETPKGMELGTDGIPILPKLTLG